MQSFALGRGLDAATAQTRNALRNANLIDRRCVANL
jgi:hypothetical protein